MFGLFPKWTDYQMADRPVFRRRHIKLPIDGDDVLYFLFFNVNIIQDIYKLVYTNYNMVNVNIILKC